ncbi:hypothetical protein MWU59_11940 [Flavobacteriaceae bacterium F08102]|nr:hypothetical protein [Flavobacteriaceae bacterium F08102]
MQAVITGDLIDSTTFSASALNTILNAMNREFDCLKASMWAEFRLFRGDSFQGVIADPSLALDAALFIKTRVNMIPNEVKGKGLIDVKMAIGLGVIDLKRPSILESNGEAFQLSGRTLDVMKGDYPRLLLKTNNEDINDEFDVHFSLFDSLTSKWSVASAEVIYYMLKGLKEREIAAELGINQSAVNHRKKAANWDSIALLLERYRRVVTTLKQA